jgi:hypothetical protein
MHFHFVREHIMAIFNLLQHVKQVAKDDVRIWAAPFVAIFRTAKKELNRPLVTTRKAHITRK